MTSTIEGQLDRLAAGMQFLQLMTRTFSSLWLTERAAIADTISALIGTFLDCRVRATLLRTGTSAALEVAACEGCDPERLLSAPAAELWASAMREKLPGTLTAAQVQARWPDAPPVRGGLAYVAIDLHDEPIGVLVFANKRSYEPFSEQELSFLAVATGLASMALANADAFELLDAQRRLAEARAQQAAAEAEAKQQALHELDRKLDVIAAQQRQISALSTPILHLHRDVLVVPVIGTLDAARNEAMQSRLLDELARMGARFVILDLTGLESIDTATAEHFMQLARGARLLGATIIVTGIQAAVALTLVGLGLGLDELVSKSTLGAGLVYCVAQLR
jgi:anti-anti-sigma factor